MILEVSDRVHWSGDGYVHIGHPWVRTCGEHCWSSPTPHTPEVYFSHPVCLLEETSDLLKSSVHVWHIDSFYMDTAVQLRVYSKASMKVQLTEKVKTVSSDLLWCSLALSLSLFLSVPPLFCLWPKRLRKILCCRLLARSVPAPQSDWGRMCVRV